VTVSAQNAECFVRSSFRLKTAIRGAIFSVTIGTILSISSSHLGAQSEAAPPTKPATQSQSSKPPKAGRRGSKSKKTSNSKRTDPDKNPTTKSRKRGHAITKAPEPPPACAVVRDRLEERSEKRFSKRTTSVYESSRLLALKGIHYSGRWTPPGERSSWVMDCSNTSRYLCHQVAGVELPRTAHDQYEWLRIQRKIGEIPPDDTRDPQKLERFLSSTLRPGDLLFWTDGSRSTHISHVMVYVGHDCDGHAVIAGSEHTHGVSLYHFDPHISRTGRGISSARSRSRSKGFRFSLTRRQSPTASRLFAYGRVL
jgi:cell wall-associated NlpC family hydrolase